MGFEKEVMQQYIIANDKAARAHRSSADVWQNPTMFQLDDNLMPTSVAGCPPDAFSEDGQLWGNPLYRYDVMKQDNYSWWMDRIIHNLNM